MLGARGGLRMRTNTSDVPEGLGPTYGPIHRQQPHKAPSRTRDPQRTSPTTEHQPAGSRSPPYLQLLGSPREAVPELPQGSSFDRT